MKKIEEWLPILRGYGIRLGRFRPEITFNWCESKVDICAHSRRGPDKTVIEVNDLNRRLSDI